MVMFHHVLQVCCLFSVIVPMNSYVLFAANLDDFRNLAKKFIPEDLAEKLTAIVSQNGDKGAKVRADVNEARSVKQSHRNRTTALNNGQASSEITMHRIGDKKNRTTQSNQKVPNKYADYETQDTNINKKTTKYYDDATTQNTNVRKKLVRNHETDEKRFDKRTPQVELENDEKQNNRPGKKPTKERERIQDASVRKRPRDDIFESDSSTKKIPPYNRQENLQNEGYNKKINFESQFDNDEEQNSYLKKRPTYKNDDEPKIYSKIRQDETVFENEGSDNRGKNIRNELNTQLGKLQPHNDYDYQDVTTKYATFEDKRYRTVKRNRLSTNLYYQGTTNTKDQYGRAVNPRETLYLKRDTETVGEQNQRIVSPEAAKRERNNGIRQAKVTPIETVQFDIQEPESNGNENGNDMRIQYSRNVRERKSKKQKVMQDDQVYDKSLMNKPTTHDEEPFDKPYPPKQNTRIKVNDYFEEGNFKQMAPARTPGIYIPQKIVTEYDIFYSAEHDTKNTNVKNYGKKQVTNAENPPEREEVINEPIRARTESLNFDADYDNNTDGKPVSRFIMKGTGIPTREVYKMSSPDYYKRLPRIVEKYDFSEPIPEADRVREVYDDKYVLEPGRVNMKIKQQKQDNQQFQQRPQFQPVAEELPNVDQADIMEEFSLVRRTPL